jgi:hypothetical protein
VVGGALSNGGNIYRLTGQGWSERSHGQAVSRRQRSRSLSQGAAICALEHLGLLDESQLQPHLGRTLAPDPPATKTYARQLTKQENLYRLLTAEQGPGPHPPTQQLADNTSSTRTAGGGLEGGP